MLDGECGRWANVVAGEAPMAVECKRCDRRLAFGVSPWTATLLVFGVVALVFAAGAAASRPVPACSLVLRPHDLAGGPYVVRSRLTGLRAFAEAPTSGSAALVARLAAWGKESGCEADLVLPISAKGLQEGPLEVISSATVYRSRAGARVAFAYASRSLVPAGYGKIPVGFGLGDAAHEWVRQGSSGLGAMLVYFVLWRERDVNASILIVGRVGVVSEGSLELLARPQERRIRAALP